MRKSTNEKIAENVIALFLRMAVTLLISLYSVRLLLDILGIVDYGIYTVVAGFVSVMGFLSQSMSISIQRFYSYSIGLGKKDDLGKIFSVSMSIVIIIAIGLIIVGETVGLWFLKNKLVIPERSIDSAIWLYHFSIMTFAISIFRIPYISVLLANENMRLFSKLNIFESILKLGIVLLLPFFKLNYLFYYGLLFLGISIISLIAHVFLTRNNYPEAKYFFYYEKKLFKSMISFSGWSLFGILAGTGNNQGNNILINIFFGPTINAAREVAVQVQNAISAFSNSVYIAFKPQMIKSYAEENFEYLMKLFYFGSKAIFVINFLICFPLLLNTEEILNIWLVEVTEEMIVFTKLSLVYITIYALNNPITTIVQATGNIRKYFITVESTIFMSLPMTYVAFSLGMPAQTTFWISICVFSIAHFIRLYHLKTLIKFSMTEYFNLFVRPMLSVTLVTAVFGLIISHFIELIIESELQKIILVTSFVTIIFLISCSRFGFNNDERKAALKLVSKYKIRKKE